MIRLWTGVLLYMLWALSMNGVVYAQDDIDTQFGRRHFLQYCASCHGPTGKGDGRDAKYLTKPPTDLSKLAKNNNGIFPIARVFAVIDGRIQVMVHGSRRMPVWGDIFTQGLQERMKRDYMSKDLLDAIIRTRILTLVEYISTLQEK